MGTRTVHLDEDAEQALTPITQATGLSIANALKQGLLVLRDQIAASERCTPYAIYAALDLGAGGEALAPSTEIRRGVQDAMHRKLGR